MHSEWNDSIARSLRIGPGICFRIACCTNASDRLTGWKLLTGRAVAAQGSPACRASSRGSDQLAQFQDSVWTRSQGPQRAAGKRGTRWSAYWSTNKTKQSILDTFNQSVIIKDAAWDILEHLGGYLGERTSRRRAYPQPRDNRCPAGKCAKVLDGQFSVLGEQLS